MPITSRGIKMINFNEAITNCNFYHCIYREGFVFTSIDGPANIFDAIVIRNPENCDCWSPKKSFSEHSLERHIAFINEHKIQKACIIAENIRFISKCPSLKYLEIIPADTATSDFDYSPLYSMPEITFLSCRTNFGGISEPFNTSVDYSKITGLKKLDITGSGHLNYSCLETLNSIDIGYEKTNTNLKDIGSCSNLKELTFVKTALRNLSGIEKYEVLEKLSISYAHSLNDISELIYVSNNLRCLHIDTCPKITDFSCLQQMKQLEHLSLCGNNTLNDLSFLNEMKKLKTFSFSMNVLDGDLSPCLKIPYVNSYKNRKHYNFKDKELPKQRI